MSSSSTPGQPLVKQAVFSGECTELNDLIKAGIARPEIRMEMEYTNQRTITSLFASGNVTPYGINNTERAKLTDLDKMATKAVGANAWQFPVMGKLDKASTILGQVGSTQADGRFQLRIKERTTLYDGMVCMFNGNMFMAQVEGNPQGNEVSGWIFSFKSLGNVTFDYATHVARQAGTKTLMGMYTGYSEGSKRGHSYSSTPSIYVNWTTTQRKTVEITGDAASQVLWYTFTSSNGTQSKGWMYQAIQQNQALFIKEDEMQKIFGVTNMKDANGNALLIAPIDPNTGYGKTMGDGIVEQISGGLVVEGSSADGNWNLDDLTEAMTNLEQYTDKITGCKWGLITGTRGFGNFQAQAAQLGINTNINWMNTMGQDGKVGGPDANVGYNFISINVNGNQMICIKHPLFDDPDMWTELGQDGNPVMSSFGILLDIGSQQSPNMEVFYKSANGVNRKDVRASINGLTGDPGTSVSEEDFNKFAMLKQELIVLYRTKSCAIIKKRPIS